MATRTGPNLLSDQIPLQLLPQQLTRVHPALFQHHPSLFPDFFHPNMHLKQATIYLKVKKLTYYLLSFILPPSAVLKTENSSKPWKFTGILNLNTFLRSLALFETMHH